MSKCPTWDDLLKEIFPEEKDRLKVQKLLGSTLLNKTFVSIPCKAVDVPKLVKDICRVIKEEFPDNPGSLSPETTPEQIIQSILMINVRVDAVKRSVYCGRSDN